MKEKRTCENPTHPFKQNWYWYHGYEQDDAFDESYCSSCAHLMRTTAVMIEATISPHATLYGDEYIRLSRAQLHHLLDAAYDNIEARD